MSILGSIRAAFARVAGLRSGSQPAADDDLREELQAHLDMLLKYTDTNMHNLTAYLVTLK